MPHYVAFLRGINLGKRRITMDRLRALFEEMGFVNVATFIASGNVRFQSKVRDDRKLAEQIERHLAKSLGYAVETFVRTRDEVAAVAAFQPFEKADLTNPDNTTHVGFMKEKPSAESARKFMSCGTKVDALYVDGREFYWLCRIKSHESKIWTTSEVKSAGLPSATMRNLTTIRKLAALPPVFEVCARNVPTQPHRPTSGLKKRRIATFSLHQHNPIPLG